MDYCKISEDQISDTCIVILKYNVYKFVYKLFNTLPHMTIIHIIHSKLK